jgi:hypothetical protein
MSALSTSHRALRTVFRIIVLSLFLIFITSQPTNAQSSCPNEPEPGGESISGSVSINGSSQPPMIDGAFLSAGTQVRLDAVANAGGQCKVKGWVCPQGTNCTCEVLDVQQRTINHTIVDVDITSSGVWNGTYRVGTVQFLNQYDHTQDSHSANTTGPLYFTLSLPGTYTFRFYATINITGCYIYPDVTPQSSVTVYVSANDDGANNGTNPCDVGEPVNVTNGNMYLQQTDYRLPGIGDGLEITRTYNSKNQTAGLFGYGWSSILDESVVAYGTNLLRLNLPDGRAAYFTRSSPSAPYVAVGAFNFYGQVVKNADNTYTLTFKDGRVHQFNANGRLVSFPIAMATRQR